jgi:hypothetical protein
VCERRERGRGFAARGAPPKRPVPRPRTVQGRETRHMSEDLSTCWRRRRDWRLGGAEEAAMEAAVPSLSRSGASVQGCARRKTRRESARVAPGARPEVCAAKWPGGRAGATAARGASAASTGRGRRGRGTAARGAPPHRTAAVPGWTAAAAGGGGRPGRRTRAGSPRRLRRRA